MKAFVATHETQGQRRNDFCWADEGEMLRFQSQHTLCSDPDDECGCGRALIGVGTHKGTTTAKVVEIPLDLTGLGLRLRDSLQAAGFRYPEAYYRHAAEDIMLAAMPFDIDDVVERRGHVFAKRDTKVAPAC